MSATPFRFASSKNSIGFWRKMLKIICSEARPSCSRQTSASSSDSTLAPKCLIFPSRFRMPERLEDLAVAQDFGRDAVELRQVERLDAEPPKRRFRVRAEGVEREVCRPARLGEAAELRGDEDAFRKSCCRNLPMSSSLRPEAVNVSRVEEVDAARRRRPQRLERLLSSTSPQSAPPSCQVPRPISETSSPSD